MLRKIINLLTEPADKGRAQGPDISHWNVKTAGFNPETAKERIDFIFQKITEGTRWVDPQLDENWKGVQKVPIRFAYHYQRAGLSWKDQVRHFYNVASAHNFHGLVIDLEKTNNVDASGKFITGDTFFTDTRRMIEELWKVTPTVILYTNTDVYKNYLRPAMYRVYRDEGIQWLENNPRLIFWYAQYWLAWSVNKEPSLPPTRRPNAWDFWQITEAAKGSDWGVQSGHVDVNVYNGTPQQLADRLGVVIPTPGETPTDPPPVVVIPDEPIPGPDEWTGKVVAFNTLIVRRYPRLSSDTDTGARLRYGDPVTGNLWTGHGYVWMRLTVGKWVAVRQHPSGDSFIKLNPQQDPIEELPEDELEIVRVVWDDENPDFQFKCRTQTETHIRAKRPPAVNRFYPRQKDGSLPKDDKAGDFRVNMETPHNWRPAMVKLNGGGDKGEHAVIYLTGKNRATYNKGAGSSGWPMQMYVVFSGNLLKGRFIGAWFVFKTLKPGDLIKSTGMTIHSNPYQVHRFTCVGWDQETKKTKRINSTGTPRGDVFHYVVTNEGEGCIPAKHVKRVSK